MSNYGWTNEAGEPIMDGAAWRFEQQLDMDSQDDYYADHFYDEDDDCDGNCSLDDANLTANGWECMFCGALLDGEPEGFDPDPMEDQWLDGSYEE